MEINQSIGNTGTKNLTTTPTDLSDPQFDITINDYETEIVYIQGTLRFKTTDSKSYIRTRLSRDSTVLRSYVSGIGYFESSNSYLTLSFSYYDKLSSNDTYTYKIDLSSSSVSPAPVIDFAESCLSVSKIHIGTHNIVQENWS